MVARSVLAFTAVIGASLVIGTANAEAYVGPNPIFQNANWAEVNALLRQVTPPGPPTTAAMPATSSARSAWVRAARFVGSPIRLTSGSIALGAAAAYVGYRLPGVVGLDRWVYGIASGTGTAQTPPAVGSYRAFANRIGCTSGGAVPAPPAGDGGCVWTVWLSYSSNAGATWFQFIDGAWESKTAGGPPRSVGEQAMKEALDAFRASNPGWVEAPPRLMSGNWHHVTYRTIGSLSDTLEPTEIRNYVAATDASRTTITAPSGAPPPVDPGSPAALAALGAIAASTELAEWLGLVVDPDWDGPSDWTMPSCVGLATAACEQAVDAAAAAAGNAEPTVISRVNLTRFDPEQAAGAVVHTEPAPTSTGKPTTVTLETNPPVMPILVPAPQVSETYVDYLARIRALGWLGAATVVDLDADEGDPSFGSSGVPCRYPIATVRLAPDAPITFFRNPTVFNGAAGGSSADWDCNPGGVPPLPDCEYDAAFVPYYTWAVGRTYAQERYDDACAAAWSFFLASGGFALEGKRESLTGVLKDPYVLDFLTIDGSDGLDWRKWEWGPFSTTAGGQTLTFVVHGYKNLETGEVRQGRDKIKFRTEIAP